MSNIRDYMEYQGLYGIYIGVAFTRRSTDDKSFMKYNTKIRYNTNHNIIQKSDIIHKSDIIQKSYIIQKSDDNTDIK